MRVGVDLDHRARPRPPRRSPRRGRPRSRRGRAAAGPVGWPSIVTRGFETARTIRRGHLLARHAEAANGRSPRRSRTRRAARRGSRASRRRRMSHSVPLKRRNSSPNFAFRASIAAHCSRTRSIAQARRRSRPTREWSAIPRYFRPGGAGGLGHLLEGGAAVAPVGVAMERAGQVRRARPGRAAGRARRPRSRPQSSRSSGGMYGQAERREQVGLGPAGDRARRGLPGRTR